MLHEFLTSNREELIARCREKVAKRFEPNQSRAAVDNGVPLFLAQLAETLVLEQSTAARGDSAPEPTPEPTEIGRAAALHGAELLRLGYTVDQVVHDYGDVCQSVTELAGETAELITNDEFRTLNACLDNAIADAVTAYGRSHAEAAVGEAKSQQAGLEAYAKEHRRLVDTSLQAFEAVRTGSVGLTGSTGKLLYYTLQELHSLPERKLNAS